MKVLGLVLAGGKSTRFNHKLFLTHLETNRPVVYRAMRFASEFCSNVYVSCSADNLKALRHLFSSSRLLVDSKQEGIVPIIESFRQKAKEEDYSHIFVVCGDNIYPLHWERLALYVLDPLESLVCTAEVPIKQTHMINNENRIVSKCHIWKRSLLTPWILSTATNAFSNTIDLRPYLNSFNPEKCLVEDTTGWADLGTPESVEAYYRC